MEYVEGHSNSAGASIKLHSVDKLYEYAMRVSMKQILYLMETPLILLN